mmetsp:Transcript_1791/g.4660  ORF Transcript_1791/g.4660 Transcript_1791/m.4660 type:complete len:214 (+) Transcript_1791:2367-3008(+)
MAIGARGFRPGERWVSSKTVAKTSRGTPWWLASRQARAKAGLCFFRSVTVGRYRTKDEVDPRSGLRLAESSSSSSSPPVFPAAATIDDGGGEGGTRQRTRSRRQEGKPSDSMNPSRSVSRSDRAVMASVGVAVTVASFDSGSVASDRAGGALCLCLPPSPSVCVTLSLSLDVYLSVYLCRFIRISSLSLSLLISLLIDPTRSLADRLSSSLST